MNCFTPGYEFWAEMACVLTGGTVVTVGLAALASHLVRSAAWRRSIWHSALLALIGLCLWKLSVRACNPRALGSSCGSVRGCKRHGADRQRAHQDNDRSYEQSLDVGDCPNFRLAKMGLSLRRPNLNRRFDPTQPIWGDSLLTEHDRRRSQWDQWQARTRSRPADSLQLPSRHPGFFLVAGTRVGGGHRDLARPSGVVAHAALEVPCPDTCIESEEFADLSPRSPDGWEFDAG